MARLPSNSTVGGKLIANKHDYVRQPAYAVASGTDTYVVTLDPKPSSYADGMGLVVKFANANTGASTLNVNGLGAIPIKDREGNDVEADALLGIVSLRYDAGNFILLTNKGGGIKPSEGITTTMLGQVTRTQIMEKFINGYPMASSLYRTNNLRFDNEDNIHYFTFSTWYKLDSNTGDEIMSYAWVNGVDYQTPYADVEVVETSYDRKFLYMGNRQPRDDGKSTLRKYKMSDLSLVAEFPVYTAIYDIFVDKHENVFVLHYNATNPTARVSKFSSDGVLDFMSSSGATGMASTTTQLAVKDSDGSIHILSKPSSYIRTVLNNSGGLVSNTTLGSTGGDYSIITGEDDMVYFVHDMAVYWLGNFLFQNRGRDAILARKMGSGFVLANAGSSNELIVHTGEGQTASRDAGVIARTSSGYSNSSNRIYDACVSSKGTIAIVVYGTESQHRRIVHWTLKNSIKVKLGG